jgi:hypothetical protein
VYAFSQEVGTISNGSISQKRVLNGARSQRANLHFFLKFGIRVNLETIEEFQNRLYDYVKSKPREWIRPVAFRLNMISADLGYTEYFVLLNHRGMHTFVGCGVSLYWASTCSSIFFSSLQIVSNYVSYRIMAKRWCTQELFVRCTTILLSIDC